MNVYKVVDESGAIQGLAVEQDGQYLSYQFFEGESVSTDEQVLAVAADHKPDAYLFLVCGRTLEDLMAGADSKLQCKSKLVRVGVI